MDTLTIGKIARLAGVGIETVRFYEREGLLEAPARRPSGYREYHPETADRLRFIRRAKELGFSLKEIRELLALRLDPRTTCADVRKRARSKLEDVRERIRALRRMERTLGSLAAACRGRGPVRECPILEALDHKPGPRRSPSKGERS